MKIKAVSKVLDYIIKTGKALIETDNNEEYDYLGWEEYSEKYKDNDLVQRINKETKKLENIDFRRMQVQKAKKVGALDSLKKQIENPESRLKVKSNNNSRTKINNDDEIGMDILN